MTTEEQLDWLCRLRSEIYVYMPKEWLIPMNNALDMAIKALEQEPTTKNDLGVDCISRAEAIRVASGYCHPSNVAKELAKLPSVTPQESRWIPVEEKLPEDGQNVLFCDIDNDIMVGYHVKGRPNTHFSQDGTYEDMKNVRAWMPLPKQYEPQESEDKQ